MTKGFQANNHLHEMEKLKFVFLLHFWIRILCSLLKVNKVIQKPELI